MTKNHFATLGVNIGAEEDEIKKAFRSLAKVWHPDKNKNPGAEEKFKEISAAYDYLQNKDRREILTRELTKKQEPSSGSYTQPTPTSNRENKGTETKPSQEPDTANKAGPSCFKENHKEGASKKKTHWSDSFRTGKSKKNARDTDWKPWNRDWTDGFDASTLLHLQKEFGPPASRGFQFTAFCSEEDPFEQGLGQRPRPQTFQKPKQPKAKSPTRCVAPEHGYAGGLDEQYLFSPRTSPNRADNLKGYEEDPIDDDALNDDNSKHKVFKDWQSSHEDILNRIRQDRKAYQAKLAQEASDSGKDNKSLTVTRPSKKSTAHPNGSDTTSNHSSPSPPKDLHARNNFKQNSRTAKTSSLKDKLKTPSPPEPHS
ncbi:hypothetical protein C0Q70_12244 [Pomacea canaliculata]|uniref:J domain-containing protein n=1 Tax=Pomacea canaliculata TaxID=400727 RepID=A0A2T7P102_POMCA|nr:hypothetical protein C0Q70_12244 [Pomacea canaliculata]